MYVKTIIPLTLSLPIFFHNLPSSDKVHCYKGEYEEKGRRRMAKILSTVIIIPITKELNLKYFKKIGTYALYIAQIIEIPKNPKPRIKIFFLLKIIFSSIKPPSFPSRRIRSSYSIENPDALLAIYHCSAWYYTVGTTVHMTFLF